MSAQTGLTHAQTLHIDDWSENGLFVGINSLSPG